jgi:hypothetical protein
VPNGGAQQRKASSRGCAVAGAPAAAAVPVCPAYYLRAVPSFELAISQAIYHSKWLLGRFLGLMKGIEGQATETAA